PVHATDAKSCWYTRRILSVGPQLRIGSRAFALAIAALLASCGDGAAPATELGTLDQNACTGCNICPSDCGGAFCSGCAYFPNDCLTCTCIGADNCFECIPLNCNTASSACAKNLACDGAGANCIANCASNAD